MHWKSNKSNNHSSKNSKNRHETAEVGKQARGEAQGHAPEEQQGQGNSGKRTGIAFSQAGVWVARSSSKGRGGMCSRILHAANVSSGRTRVDVATSARPIPWERTSAAQGSRQGGTCSKKSSQSYST